ncbi:15633_t:CDS:2, partial [Racocetra persica]
MASRFDDISKKYHKVRQNDNDVYAAFEMYTIISLLPYESLKGKTVLVLACGTGPFCRIAVELGAESVIRVDISSEMINIGKKIEEETGKLGEFDVIWAPYLIMYAKDIVNLKQMIQVAYDNLKPSSRFITLVLQPIVGDSWPPDNAQIRKYGRTINLTSN